MAVWLVYESWDPSSSWAGHIRGGWFMDLLLHHAMLLVTWVCWGGVASIFGVSCLHVWCLGLAPCHWDCGNSVVRETVSGHILPWALLNSQGICPDIPTVIASVDRIQETQKTQPRPKQNAYAHTHTDLVLKMWNRIICKALHLVSWLIRSLHIQFAQITLVTECPCTGGLLRLSEHEGQCITACWFWCYHESTTATMDVHRQLTFWECFFVGLSQESCGSASFVIFAALCLHDCGKTRSTLRSLAV